MRHSSEGGQTRGDDEYNDFLSAAEDAVRARMPHVVALLGTGTLSGSWHPNGFATFEIELVDGLGLIRLHVWARRLRPSVPGHPDIHSHSFHLYSRVLCGSYRENQYAVSEAAAGSQGLCAYRVAPTGREGPDILQPDSSPLAVAPLFSEDLVFPAGSCHDLRAGVFHATLVPADDFCATVAVLGRHLPGVNDVLVGEASFDQLTRSRPRLTPDEVDEVCLQFAGEWSTGDGR